MVTLLGTKRSAITFDVGASGIRAYQLREHRRGPSLVDMLHLDLATQLPTDQPETDDKVTIEPALVNPALLARLVGQGRFAGREVALVISPPDVQFLPMHLPPQTLDQPPEKIQQALRYEVARDSRHSAEGLEVRYWTLPGARGQQANVMAVVMSATLANQWCRQLDDQSLALRRIDVAPCALVRLTRQLWTPADDDLWGILDLGLRHSTLTVVVGTTPTYIRTLSNSAARWTRLIAEAFEVPPDVAEQLKREHGVVTTQRGIDKSTESRALLRATDLPSAFASVLRDALRTLTQEVERCFSYVMQSFPEHGVKRLVVAGGGSDMLGLPSVLEAELGVPISCLTNAPDRDATNWEHPLNHVPVSAAVGAAVGGALLDLEAS